MPASPGTILLIFGSNAVEVNKFPHTIISVHGRPALVLDMDEATNTLALMMEVRSIDNRIIVKMDKSGFTVNPNNYFKMDRPDRTSLVVFDQEGRRVLNARYVNRGTFLIDGMLNIPGAGMVDIGFKNISNNCFAAQAFTSDINIM